MFEQNQWRLSPQPVAPARKPQIEPGKYDLYPGFPLGQGQIQAGYASLARSLADYSTAVLDGFGGVFWDQVRRSLETEFAKIGLRTAWISVNEALRPEAEIDSLLRPAVGQDDPVFGTRFQGSLADFFDPRKLQQLSLNQEADLTILYGTGSALARWAGALVYFELPKNEIQYRSRAGAICNLGRQEPAPAEEMYKRFYFVDWVVLNAHKQQLLPRIDFLVDEQRPQEITWMRGQDLRQALERMSRSGFRVRAWFEPGVWGGHWSEQHIPQLSPDAPNYAWSFEFISPENGIVFESGGYLLEASFDLLMFQEHRAVLGECAERFGYEFPLRFNFLDTVQGGELAIQCHPRLDYIRRHFGERFTQDESYYILDCRPGSRVWLGFQEGVDPQDFRQALEDSLHQQKPVEIEQYVQLLPTHRHDYFLIPAATVHAAGVNNLVLEISATPYIFTFKLYDWLVKDLNGELRPLHLEHGFNNLDFHRRGSRVQQELISRPEELELGPGWKVERLPTHPEHFYAVFRFEFSRSIEWETGGSFNVLNLVEGESIRLEIEAEHSQRYNWAETFIIPAAVRRYKLINEGRGPVKVVMACMKEEALENHA
jgi:mannose-6-phosphate isomerase class I